MTDTVEALLNKTLNQIQDKKLRLEQQRVAVMIIEAEIRVLIEERDDLERIQANLKKKPE